MSTLKKDRTLKKDDYEVKRSTGLKKDDHFTGKNNQTSCRPPPVTHASDLHDHFQGMESFTHGRGLVR